MYALALDSNSSSSLQRVPKISPIRDKTIALFGLGSIGANVAIELARNGVEKLVLLDYDYVDPGTAVRWPLGLEYAGYSKTSSIVQFIHNNYPNTKVEFFDWKIGAVGMKPIIRRDGPMLHDDHEIIQEMLKDASMVFEATAEIGVQHFLSVYAKSYGIPMISVEATQGVYGGQVMRQLPNSDSGCWWCLAQYQKEGIIPIAPKDENGAIQAAGCGDLSFTGTSFDLQNIIIAGVRLAISTLCEGIENAYPSLNFDVGILSLVDKTGNAISPKWDQCKIQKHPSCKYCSS